MSAVKIRRVISASGLTYEMTLPMKGYPDIDEKGLTLDQVLANLVMYFEGRHPSGFGDDYGRVVIERARRHDPQPTGKRAEKSDITPEEVERFMQGGTAQEKAPFLSKPGEESETLEIDVHSVCMDSNDRVLLKCPDCDKNFTGIVKGLGEIMEIEDETSEKGENAP